MTTDHSTQSTPHPPKQPLYLSPDELCACDDIDRNGIDKASRDSLNPVGLLLNVDGLTARLRTRRCIGVLRNRQRGRTMKLACKELKTHLTQRLKDQNTLPVRIHMLFDDLNPLLRQHKQIDVFDLLVELILCADNDPAQHLCALLAVLDDEALINLDRNALANCAAFVRDAMKRDSVRWQLEAFHNMQKGKKKRKG